MMKMVTVVPYVSTDLLPAHSGWRGGRTDVCRLTRVDLDVEEGRSGAG